MQDQELRSFSIEPLLAHSSDIPTARQAAGRITSGWPTIRGVTGDEPADFQEQDPLGSLVDNILQQLRGAIFVAESGVENVFLPGLFSKFVDGVAGLRVLARSSVFAV